VDALAAGTYAIRIASPNFMPFQRDALVVSAGGIQTLNVRLEIQGQTSKVTISENAGLSVDPSQNAGQLILKGSELDSLSDDVEDLSNELQMLAGPAAGPDGGQIYIDGFSGSRMPPKQVRRSSEDRLP
jgi:hypothetical protein